MKHPADSKPEAHIPQILTFSGYPTPGVGEAGKRAGNAALPLNEGGSDHRQGIWCGVKYMIDWLALRNSKQMCFLTGNSIRATPHNMASFVPSSSTMLVACAPIFYILFLVCRHLSSQLRSIPGPLLARFTDAWYLWKVRAGDFHHRNQRLHDIYGSAFFDPKYPHGNLHLTLLFQRPNCALWPKPV
jgi:hypothetical protein